MPKETTLANRRSRVARVATAAGVASALIFSVVSCSVAPNTAYQSPASSAAAADNTVKGNGVKVDTPSGSYERVAFSPNAPIYTEETSEIDHVLNEGWSLEEFQSGKRFALDYVLSEFLDSSALEGGDPSYQSWHAKEAPKYFTESVYKEISDGTGNVVLGNFNEDVKNRIVPDLIKDGSPRINNVEMSFKGYQDNTADTGVKGILYTIEYNGDYRVSDASAASYISEYSIRNLPVEKHLTPEQFLASDMATTNLKDNTGENKLPVRGHAFISITKNAEGAWVINGFESSPKTYTINLTQNDEEYFQW